MIDYLQANFAELENIQVLGDGGQKQVFSAEHPTHGAVVLKIIRSSQDNETIKREILAVQKVQSTRVPQILNTGVLKTNVGDVNWILEQRILGDSLSARLVQGPLNTGQLLLLAEHILDSLVAAEHVQIVHRDVKPDNIMCDATGYWLLDFGIARHLTLASLTNTASPFGKFTPGYAPPEQFKNWKSTIDARTDLFAMGVTLYEAHTGQNPFIAGARDLMEMMKRAETMPLPRVSFGIPEGNSLSDLLHAMTQKRRDHRPRTAQEAQHWLGSILAAQTP